MSDEDKDDRQHEPSEQKLRKAREKGDIPRSAELNVAAMYLGAWLAFAVGAGLAVRAWLSMATRALGAEGWTPGTADMTRVSPSRTLRRSSQIRTVLIQTPSEWGDRPGEGSRGR